MRRWKTGAGVAAIVLAAGAVAGIGPILHGQSPGQAAGPRVFQFRSGPGSWVGVSVREVGTGDVAKAKLPAATGVMVEEVSRNSPAESAGMRAGDVIVEFDGERIRGTRQFARLVQETPVGRKVQASVMRDGQQVPVTHRTAGIDGSDVFRGLRCDAGDRAWMGAARSAGAALPARGAGAARTAIASTGPGRLRFRGALSAGAAAGASG